MEPEGILAGHAFEAVGREDIAADRRQERSGRVERGPRLIPLEEDELDVVESAPLTGPEGSGELIDRPRSVRKKSLHERFRARLEPLGGGIDTIDHDRDRIDVCLREHLE